jgi:hypothetical protein
LARNPRRQPKTGQLFEERYLMKFTYTRPALAGTGAASTAKLTPFAFSTTHSAPPFISERMAFSTSSTVML